MSEKAKKKTETAEAYVSGEQYRALQANKTASPRRVTLAMPSPITMLIVIVLCLLSFWGGTIYHNHHTTVVDPAVLSSGSPSGAGGSGGQRSGFGGARRAGGFGQVTAVTSTSITISNRRTGADNTYTINSSTAISDNGQAVSASDIQSGDTVMIMTSGSGSTTATRILVNPSFGGGRFGSTAAPTSPGSNTVQSN